MYIQGVPPGFIQSNITRVNRNSHFNTKNWTHLENINLLKKV